MPITDGQAVDNGIVHIYEQYAPHTDVFIMGDRYGLESLRDAITKVIEKVDQHTIDVFCNDGEGYTIKIKVVSDTNILPVPYTAEYARETSNVSLIDIWTIGLPK